ncbi:signal peptidase I [Haloarchaeobius amylolyticus]|uniref:Signal peptidase I n=1 Tax=Haloarchaeobius amylolyticus TaxID=1198296 RepID=A0ABD6BCW2_9EURY
MDKRTGAKTVALLALLVLIVPFVIYAVPGAVGADHSFVVLSGSMSPTIETGDVVIVDETDPATIQEGDVITFAQSDGETPTTHRVVDVQHRDGQVAFETKGDANEEPDPAPVPSSNVLGTVLFTIPYIGYVIQFANTTLGFVLLVGLPMGALAVSEAWQFAKRYRNKAGASTDDSSLEEVEDGSAERNPADASPTLAIHPTDLAITTIALALVTPYAAYVAFQLRTALTFSIAFASLFTALTTGGLLLTNRSSEDSQSEPDQADSPPLLAIHPTDLAMTTIVLVLVTPYAAYVAFQLRTALTFSIVFASLFLALATGGRLLAERFPKDDRSQPNPDSETEADDDASPDPAPDGGSVEEVE